MTTSRTLTRRRFIQSAVCTAALAVSGCASSNRDPGTFTKLPTRREFGLMYGSRPDERFPIPSVDLSKIPRKFYRRRVRYETDERPGSVVVDTKNFFLYLVEGEGTAMRYGVGLGRAGFEWSGRGRIAWKQQWPKWTPPDEMIARQPELEKYSVRNGGMPPGLKNPLGSRALYIFEGRKDTLYRVHGSPEYWTIGKAVSSGCVRMVNQDVIDLYDRVRTNVPILVV